MTDENQDETLKWMKRLRWAQSGVPLLDERINALASLWAEGELPPWEVIPEARELIRMSTLRPEKSEGSDSLEVYAKNVLIAAQWIALVQVMHFCEKHRLRSQDERVEAFRIFEDGLNQTGREAGVSPRSWIADACDYRSQTEDVTDEVHQLVRRWATGGEIADERDLADQIEVAGGAVRARCRPNLDDPQAAAPLWIDAVRASVQALMLRETDAYCRAVGYTEPSERVQAWRAMLEELQKPGRKRGI